MEKQTITQADISKKERELEVAEEDYRNRQKFLEQKSTQLYDRYCELTHIINNEAELMIETNRRFSQSPDSSALFFHTLEDIQYQSDEAHQREQYQVECDREDCQRDFYKKRDKLESEITQLRRQWYESTDS